MGTQMKRLDEMSLLIDKGFFKGRYSPQNGTNLLKIVTKSSKNHFSLILILYIDFSI